ncbi:hypothetical protein GCM10007424_15810 [Flavobacterium suaedae]|uniref:Uncharacterized protein n=1 Tax=Flavobacterium suaedae TaxID=1767027 RepID=A0ABQ1JSP3_9FLAO|nr:hypothetical protein GCM10007424_15810 [Flavobacterium suaedae]
MTMKALHKINIVALAITLLLYFTVYLGMCAQVLLGVIQLVIASIISLYYSDRLSQKLKKNIKIYWILVGTSLVMAYIFWTYFKYNDFLIVTLFVIPMLIACYFAYLTYKITQYLITSSK